MAYLAPPPQDPIPIDAGVIYNYVIAQQGYGAISVDPLNNFSFAVTQGEPGLLLFRFDGTPGATSTSHTITLHIGSQTQTLHVNVLATNAFQRVANITNPPSVSAPAGSAISVLLTTTSGAGLGTTDVGPAGPLPTGLSFDSINNRITGAIADPGFYPVILEAKKSAFPQVYRRYLVFTVSAASTSPTNPVSGTSPSGGRLLFDGDFTEAQIAGIAEYEIPFPEDPRPYLYRIPYWQLIDHYEEPELGSAGPLGGFYVGGAQASFKAIGGGVVEFKREFATVPASRSEYESFVYPYQLVQWKVEDGVFSASINEVPTTMMSRVQYDYFVVGGSSGLVSGSGGGSPFSGSNLGGWTLGTPTAGAIDSIPLPKAPRAMVDSGVFATYLYFMHGYQTIYTLGGVPIGTEFLAEDSTMRRWKGHIYERKCRFLIAEGFTQAIT
jgi:Putative Ig domain